MGRVVLACKSDEERKMATRPVFAPYPIHTDRQAESARHCVGFRTGITGWATTKALRGHGLTSPDVVCTSSDMVAM